MPVLRIFGRKRFQYARAQGKGIDQQGEQVQAGESGNGWQGSRMTQTTQTMRLSRPLQVESEWIGTRRYFANLPYTLPKDALEADRLDFQHYYFRRLLKGLYLAPLEKRRLAAVLDIGCGTGRWAYDMAQDLPRAQIVGLDIEIPRPGALAVPSNLKLVHGNVLERLPFADRSFNFVHQRLLVAAIPTPQWPIVVAELARVTTPGGWIELIEAGDAYLNVGPALSQFLHWSRVVSEERGIDVGRVAYLDDLLLEAGLQKVEKRVMRVPVGSWGGRLGYALAQDTLAAFEGLRGLFCQKVPLPPEQFNAILAALPDEWNIYHTEFAIFATYGQVRTDI